ncbi:MAG: ATP-grasp domain-containing protein [Methylotenera sp.]|nr:ATP-grasp domain-containing protein [Methylotenera sp.]
MAAVKSGYAVTAIDAFADKQTIESAKKTVVVGFDAQGFIADDLLKVIAQLDLRNCLGCIYGGGFEAQPELLQKIAEVVPVIGNTSNTVAAIKHAAHFFSALRRLNIAHPAVFDVLPECDGSNKPVVYLKKFAAGSGGVHIKLVNSGANLINKKLLNNEYYQQQLNGQSVSLLFFADRHKVEVVGFNEQWLNPCVDMPFRYGGAVSHVALPNSVQQQLTEAAIKLTVAFGLLGLNSLDAIVQDNKIYVLEVNPRLTATVDLYDNSAISLIDRHVQVCLNQEGFGSEYQSQQSQVQKTQVKKHKAHAIVYVASDTEIAPSIEWPSWVVDTPSNIDETKKISAGDPVCTVTAYDDSAESAKQLVYARVKIVQKLLKIKTSPPQTEKLAIVEKV